MSKGKSMKKNSIEIYGERLRKILEKETNKSVYELALEQGFSKNFIAEACRSGIASPTLQAVVKLYGIMPEDYKKKEETPPEDRKQLSIFDYSGIDRDELKEIVKEAVRELIAEENKKIEEKRIKEDLEKCKKA